MTVIRDLAQHEPSPRRGFTMVGDHITEVGPVVVRIDGSTPSYRALRTAAEVAMSRSCGMAVLEEQGTSRFSDLDERDRSTAEAILRNSHVTVTMTIHEDLDTLAGRCRQMGASMLVLSQADFRGSHAEPQAIPRLAAEHFDLLLVAE